MKSFWIAMMIASLIAVADARVTVDSDGPESRDVAGARPYWPWALLNPTARQRELAAYMAFDAAEGGTAEGDAPDADSLACISLQQFAAKWLQQKRFAFTLDTSKSAYAPGAPAACVVFTAWK